VEETTWNKLHLQSLENIYVKSPLAGRQWHIVSAVLQAAELI